MPTHYAISRSCDLEGQSLMHDWMRAIRTPTPYRIGSSVQLNTVMVAKVGIVLLLLLTFVVMLIPAADYNPAVNRRLALHQTYNATYPLSPPEQTSRGTRYKVAAIADLDTDSKVSEKSWVSYLKIGHLTISPDHRQVWLEWDEGVSTLKSAFSQGGRGMELSELTAFNGRLYAVDDRTGIVFQVTLDHGAHPWVILADGDGNTEKGFKAEWAAVKDKALWVGGLGKEWTTQTGEVQNLNPQWVKSIGYFGDVVHHDWHENYDALRRESGYLPPGYIIHESGVWSDIHKQWFFLPRRASRDRYDDVADERRATNLLFRSSEDFSTIQMQRMGPFNPTHGFSSFKFVPGTQDRVILALKTEEDQGKITSYATVLTIDGDVLLEEMEIGDKKYEGVEFV